jgi:hypothetical protein
VHTCVVCCLQKRSLRRAWRLSTVTAAAVLFPFTFYIHLYIFLFLFWDVRTHIEISTLQVLISLSRLRKSPFNQLSIFAYFKSGRILGIRDIIGHLAWKISASATKQDLWFIYLR